MITISVFQTIQTKYVGPTNFKGTRIKARTSAGTAIIRSYDYGLNIGENHAKVAKELHEKMKWHADLVGGQNADGSYTWIMVGATGVVKAIDALERNLIRAKTHFQRIYKSSTEAGIVEGECSAAISAIDTILEISA